MAEDSFPFDGQASTETQYSYLMREAQDNGVIGDDEGGFLKPYVSGSGLQVNIDPGRAFVRGFMYSNTATQTVTLPAPGAGLSRVDYILLRLDPATNKITLTYRLGTPTNGVAVPPALEQTDTAAFELPLAMVRIPAGASVLASNNVTDMRVYLGQRIGLWNTDARPTNALSHRMGFNLDTGFLERYVNGQWQPVLGNQVEQALVYMQAPYPDLTSTSWTTLVTCTPALPVPLWARDGGSTVTVEIHSTAAIVTSPASFDHRIVVGTTAGAARTVMASANSQADLFNVGAFTVPAGASTISPVIQAHRKTGSGGLRGSASSNLGLTLFKAYFSRS